MGSGEQTLGQCSRIEAGRHIETARLRGEDPGDYLLRATLAAIEQPGTVTLPNSFD